MGLQVKLASNVRFVVSGGAEGDLGAAFWGAGSLELWER